MQLVSAQRADDEDRELKSVSVHMQRADSGSAQRAEEQLHSHVEC